MRLLFCWEIFECGEKIRENCPAYRNPALAYYEQLDKFPQEFCPCGNRQKTVIIHVKIVSFF